MTRNLDSQIRTEWFPNHVATLTTHGDLKVLQWAQPGTRTYLCRYVFDGDKVYISGDIGEAVFWLTWRADIHSFDNIHIGYFEEKLQAYSGKRRDFDSDKAVNELRSWLRELKDRDRTYDHDDMKELFESARNCDSVERWAHETVNGELNDFISNLDRDYWEWIYDIGNVMPARIEAYLIGLKMASEQLKCAVLEATP